MHVAASEAPCIAVWSAMCIHCAIVDLLCAITVYSSVICYVQSLCNVVDRPTQLIRIAVWSAMCDGASECTASKTKTEPAALTLAIICTATHPQTHHVHNDVLSTSSLWGCQSVLPQKPTKTEPAVFEPVWSNEPKFALPALPIAGDCHNLCPYILREGDSSMAHKSGRIRRWWGRCPRKTKLHFVRKDRFIDIGFGGI